MRALYIERDIKVATYDIDFLGHVSNIVYLRWLEDMRMQLFNAYCPFDDFIRRGITPVLASTHITYRRPVHMFDAARGCMWVSAMGKTSLTIDAEILVKDELATKARHVGVFVDCKSMKPIRLPQLFKDAVESYLAAEVPTGLGCNDQPTCDPLERARLGTEAGGKIHRSVQSREL